MKIGIIGISSLTLNFAIKAANSGRYIVVNKPSGNNTLKEIIPKIGSNIKLASFPEAAQAKIIVLFLTKEELNNILGLFPDMTDKIIIFTSGAIFNPDSSIPNISNSPSCKLIKSHFPKTHIIEVFSAIQLSTEKRYLNSDEILFYASSKRTKTFAKPFFKSLGFSPVDLSKIKS